MRFCHHGGCLSACLLAVVLVATPAPDAQAQDVFHFELVPPGGAARDIPPDGSSWHELYPTFCAGHTQTGYEDNGDGFVSECDYIYIDGVRFHIIWSGPTYRLQSGPTEGDRPEFERYMEPIGFGPQRNPICEIWHEVYPDYCNEWHVEDWADNGDGYVSPCDFVWIWSEIQGMEQFHVLEVNLNIVAVPDSPVEDSTWGKIKSFFSHIF